MLLTQVLFNNDNQLSKDIASLIKNNKSYGFNLYYTHLFLNFSKSLLMLVLCSYAVMVTDSKRLKYVISILLAVSMSFDLMSMLSTNLYYFIKPYRYENYYNFKDIYFALEILCIFYMFGNYIMGRIKTAINNYSHRHDVLCDSFISKNNFSSK